MEHRYWVGLGVALLLTAGVGGVLLGGFGPDGHRSVSYLDVTPVDGNVSAGRTVAFADLTSAQRRVFEDALEAEDGFVAIPEGVDREVWVENDYVEYRNRTYRTAVAVPG
ncbi:MAG: hypothetical protein ABEJ04_07645 [Halobacteriaceae archaeon]